MTKFGRIRHPPESKANVLTSWEEVAALGLDDSLTRAPLGWEETLRQRRGLRWVLTRDPLGVGVAVFGRRDDSWVLRDEGVKRGAQQTSAVEQHERVPSRASFVEGWWWSCGIGV